MFQVLLAMFPSGRQPNRDYDANPMNEELGSSYGNSSSRRPQYGSFPKKSRASTDNRGRNRGRRYWQTDQRDDTFSESRDLTNMSPSVFDPIGLKEKTLQKHIYELTEKNEALKKSIKEAQKRKEEKKSLANVKFGFYNYSDSEDPAGAPVKQKNILAVYFLLF